MGLEIEGGAGGHVGGNIKYTQSRTYTGNWNTVATSFFKEKNSGNNLNYENVYYKLIGENRIDNEYSSLFKNKLSAYHAITLKLDGNKEASNKYLKKITNGSGATLTQITTLPDPGTSSPTLVNIVAPIKRTEREKRNQVIQKYTVADVLRYHLNNLVTIFSHVSLLQCTKCFNVVNI